MNKYQRAKSRRIKGYLRLFRLTNPDVTYKDVKWSLRSAQRSVANLSRSINAFGRGVRSAIWAAKEMSKHRDLPEL